MAMKKMITLREMQITLREAKGQIIYTAETVTMKSMAVMG
jgi:hypothetical protein